MQSGTLCLHPHKLQFDMRARRDLNGKVWRTIRDCKLALYLLYNIYHIIIICMCLEVEGHCKDCSSKFWKRFEEQTSFPCHRAQEWTGSRSCQNSAEGRHKQSDGYCLERLIFSSKVCRLARFPTLLPQNRLLLLLWQKTPVEQWQSPSDCKPWMLESSSNENVIKKRLLLRKLFCFDHLDWRSGESLHNHFSQGTPNVFFCPGLLGHHMLLSVCGQISTTTSAHFIANVWWSTANLVLYMDEHQSRHKISKDDKIKTSLWVY